MLGLIIDRGILAGDTLTVLGAAGLILLRAGVCWVWTFLLSQRRSCERHRRSGPDRRGARPSLAHGAPTAGEVLSIATSDADKASTSWTWSVGDPLVLAVLGATAYLAAMDLWLGSRSLGIVVMVVVIG